MYQIQNVPNDHRQCTVGESEMIAWSVPAADCPAFENCNPIAAAAENDCGSPPASDTGPINWYGDAAAAAEGVKAAVAPGRPT